MFRTSLRTLVVFSIVLSVRLHVAIAADGASAPKPSTLVKFDVRSVRDGHWSDPHTWEPARVPAAGDRVQVGRGTRVVYDVEQHGVLRLVQVIGTLSFARDRNTLLNVGLVKVQNSDACSEAGFACDFHSVSNEGEPFEAPLGPMPALEVGTAQEPIPAGFTARIRLHYLDGMNQNDAPALACCSARMEFHGAPLSRTWTKLAAQAKPGDTNVSLVDDVTGWRDGDEVLVTGYLHSDTGAGQFRTRPERISTELRHIVKIEDKSLTLDAPLKHPHAGDGEFRSEVANLSRNVIVESADPDGVRGHTVYHNFSRGSICYARFAHLGKQGVLGRYPIHFHLAESTNRGGRVEGVAIVDSHNRWVTVHGTNYMIVRDCVGYRSVGHGFFLEDGTEVYNVFDHNLGLHAFRAKPLPKQVLPFDPNDGAAFWWANGRNTFVRNTSCENDEYGFRYDSQRRSNFDSNLSVLMPDGKHADVDIRTLPIYRFEDNEAHTEGLYGMVVAGTDRAAPDTQHPHVLKNLKIWQVHYALRPQVPSMWIENVQIHSAVYGVYRPEFENHVYRHLHLTNVSSEPFNRGQDDDSLQWGAISVDGLTFDGNRHDGISFIQMSDNNPSGVAESHFRNVSVINRRDKKRALVDRGGGAEVEPTTPTSVPVYLHDHYGPGRHALVVSTHSKDYAANEAAFHAEPPLTGPDSRVREIADIAFPQLLQPVDDLPPATVITTPQSGAVIKLQDGKLLIEGTTTDNVRTKRVTVNGVDAQDVDYNFHRWRVTLSDVRPGPLKLTTYAEDQAGNVERTPHEVSVTIE